MQCLNKFRTREVFLLIAVISINFASAVQIGISPAELSISVRQNEIVCSNITLFSSSNTLLAGDDKWTLGKEKDFMKYNLNADYLNIEINYNKLILVQNQANLLVCITGKNPGQYHGALLFHSENTGVGCWINLNVTGSYFSILTGAAISVRENPGKAAIMLLLALLISLILLLVILKRKS